MRSPRNPLNATDDRFLEISLAPERPGRVRFCASLWLRAPRWTTRNPSRSRRRSLTSKKVSRCAKITGVAISRRARRRRCASNCSRETNIGFGSGREVETAKVSVHIYDSEGKLVEQPDGWQKGHFAAAHIIPKSTGSYFVIVEIEQSPEERTHWALVYGFR